MISFKDYIVERRKLPYAILLVGKTAPFRQILVLYPNNQYKIGFEDNKFNDQLYAVPRRLKHRHYQKAEDIVKKIKFGGFEAHALEEDQLAKYLKVNMVKGESPSQ